MKLLTTMTLIALFILMSAGVAGACRADFIYAGGDNGVVMFDDSSYMSHPIQYYTWFWSFGDGATSLQTNTAHQYTPGTYTVTMSLTDTYDKNNTTTDTCTKTITVTPTATPTTTPTITATPTATTPTATVTPTVTPVTTPGATPYPTPDPNHVTPTPSSIFTGDSTKATSTVYPATSYENNTTVTVTFNEKNTTPTQVNNTTSLLIGGTGFANLSDPELPLVILLVSLLIAVLLLEGYVRKKYH